MSAGRPPDPSTDMPGDALAAPSAENNEDPRVVAALEEHLDACEKGERPIR